MRQPFAAVMPGKLPSRELRNALVAGVIAGLAAVALWAAPQTRALEQEIGLRWLFNLRGPVEPPANVVMVTLSRRAAGNIFLPRDPEKYHRCIDVRVGAGTDRHESLSPIPARWPRCLHAKLIDKLNRAGARTIAFDVLFRQRPPQTGLHGDVNAEQDAMLAGAMAGARNVVVAQKIEPADTDSAAAGEQPLRLSPMIEKAALGAAPFQVLPSATRRIDRYYTFGEDGWAAPGLPVVALQAYGIEAYPGLRGRLGGASNEAADLLPADPEALRNGGRLQATCLLLRQIFKRDPSLAQRLKQAEVPSPAGSAGTPRSGLLHALVSVYDGEASRLLNFIGPAGSIPAIAIDRVLSMPDPVPDTERKVFGDKMVFVGFAETSQAEQVEHFSTVFSRSDGVDLSGVEIAATAFANLLEDSSLRPAPPWLSALAVFAAGLAATALCLLLSIRIAIPVTAALAFGYGGAAVQLFSAWHLWLPVAVPLLIGAPGGIFFAVAWRYLDTRRQRDRVRRAFRHFVTPEVADELEHNAGRIAATRKSLDCICVATDAARFTTLAETMTSESVTDFLNEYFDSLFKPVIEHGGFISDVVGDAMLAIWPEGAADTRQIVCTALLEMRDAAEAFNRQSAGNRMLTRFGAHRGRVTLATVGARAHYEYRAVGDPVNTASRIQELSKKLGTRILVSRSLVTEVEGFLFRDLGLFLPRGKRTPERIFELIDRRERATAAQLDLVSGFDRALQSLPHDTKAALAAFQDLRARHPADGPTAFYIDYLLAGKPLRRNMVVAD